MYQLAYIQRPNARFEYLKYTDESGAVFSIPFDPANTDAAEFAKWLQDGNIPEAAEEGGTVTQEWVAQTITKLLGNTPLPADEVTSG
jgi:hypothetical protein